MDRFMIPKKIHYCWFGGNPLPKDAIRCIDSWKKYCPQFEIIEWNETNFDFTTCQYAVEAYRAKKWAFVSDYARFWILFKYGGLYFDTDVEMIRPINDILQDGPFMGFETDYGKQEAMGVNPGLGLGAISNMELYSEILNMYQNLHFIKPNGDYDLTTVVHHTTDLLLKKGLKEKSGIQHVAGVTVYPSEYFCPMNYLTYELNVTPNSRTIHHYSATWQDSKKARVKRVVKKIIPSELTRGIMNVKKKIRGKG